LSCAFFVLTRTFKEDSKMKPKIVISGPIIMILTTSCFFNSDTRIASTPPSTEEESTDNNSEILECPEVPVCECQKLEFPCRKGEYYTSSKACLEENNLHDWLCETVEEPVFDPCSVNVPEDRIIARYGEIQNETAFFGWFYESFRYDWSSYEHNFNSDDEIVLTYDKFHGVPPSMVLTNPSNHKGSLFDDEVVTLSIEDRTWIGASYAFVVWTRYDGSETDSEEERTTEIVLGYESSIFNDVNVVKTGKSVSVGSEWICTWIPISQISGDFDHLGTLKERLAIYHGLVPAGGKLYIDSVRFVLMTP